MPVIMRSGRAEFPDLDLLASNDADADWHIVQLVPLFIENANGAHPAVLCELPRNRGSAGFRGLQSETSSPCSSTYTPSRHETGKKYRLILSICPTQTPGRPYRLPQLGCRSPPHVAVHRASVRYHVYSVTCRMRLNCADFQRLRANSGIWAAS